MYNTFLNQELELAAKRTLTRITASEDTLKPLYLQPGRALFSAENLHIILKVYMAEKALQREYAIAQKAASIGFELLMLYPRLYSVKDSSSQSHLA